MKTLPLALTAVLLFSSAAIAQKDSLGSPTPAPDPVQKQDATPSVPNAGGVSVPGTTGAKPGTTSTTGSGMAVAPKTTEKPGDPTSGVPLTPGGLTPD